jgi:hypothetical protein
MEVYRKKIERSMKKHKSWERENKELARAGLVSWKGQCAGLLARLGQALLYQRLLCSLRGWMWGYHDWPWQRPLLLFILLGCSLVSVAFLIIQFMYLDLEEWVVVFWG